MAAEQFAIIYFSQIRIKQDDDENVRHNTLK